MPEARTTHPAATAKSAAVDTPTLVMSGAPPVDPPVKAPAAAVPAPDDKPAPTFTYQAQDGSDLRFCLAQFKPPGRIADHESDGAGIWVDVPGEGWWKTCLTEHAALTLAHKQMTGNAAITALITAK
jgi:hypothetical protein